MLCTLLATALPAGVAAAGEKRIAFSYDDGPLPGGPILGGEERTERLIEALEDGGVEQAVYFVRTDNIAGETEEQRLRALTEAGHVLANHIHGHPRLSGVGSARFIEDIDRAAEILAAYDNVRPWFRFPHLDEGSDVETRDAVRAALKERGLMNGYVTVDTYDWHMVDLMWKAKMEGQCADLGRIGEIYVEMFVVAANHYDTLARDALGRAPAQVILLHANDLAALFTDDLARALRADGWEIITADEAYEDDLADMEPETLHAGNGRITALAHQSGLRRARFDHPAAMKTPITARFDEAGVFSPCEEEVAED